ncbi:MAG: CDP-2,3-bis-(O-geranylgeranyl)-sn-glycerol synthase [Thermofilum sp.]
MSADFAAKLLVRALIWVLPAYVANATPVVTVRLYRHRGKLHPIDGGLTLQDGRRLLGENKTWEGFLGGLLGGTVASMALDYLGLHSFPEGVTLSLGALLGDLLGAFIKRRLGLAPGAPAPLLDQLDFLFGGLLLRSLLFGPVDLQTLAVLILVTPVIHWATNAAAFLLGLKQHPW